MITHSPPLVATLPKPEPDSFRRVACSMRLLSFVTVIFVLFAYSSQAQIFRAGAAVVDISPNQFPVLVNAMFTERTADKVVDPLFAKSLVLSDGTNKIAICVVDTCMLPRDLIDQAKDLAQKQIGIASSNILVSATHTHSAPSGMGCLGSRADAGYAATLPAKIAQAIVTAHAQLVPAKIGWTVTNDWRHTFNRRWIRRPDRMVVDPFGNSSARAHMHPGYQSPDAIGPSGPVDPALSIISVQTQTGEPLAILANYSQHYYDSPLISSDYYGRYAQHLARLLGATNSQVPFVGIMSQGTSGDGMWMDYGAPKKDIGYDAYARELAEETVQACAAIEYRKFVSLRMLEHTLKLKYRTPNPERLAWANEIASKLNGKLPQTLPEVYALEAIYLNARPETELKLQTIAIGDLGIAAWPNEVYAISGLKLKLQSPLPVLFNIELANGAEGYIPPPEQHKLGGYTTWPARTAGLEESAEPKITAELLAMLEQTSGLSRKVIDDKPGKYAEEVLAAKPLLYWRLNQINFGPAIDASGHGNQGTFENGVAFFLPGPGSGDGISPKPELIKSEFGGPNHINRCVHFCGGRVQATLKDLGQNYSVELWFWNGLPNDARPVTGYFFSKGKDAEKNANGDHLGIGGTYESDSTGKLIFFNGNDKNQLLKGKSILEPKQWHHVVLVRAGTKVTVYLDGNPEPEISGQADNAENTEGGEIFIGGRNDNFANFEGKLDEVAIFSRAISPKEAHNHFMAAGVSVNMTPASMAASKISAAPVSKPLSPLETLAGIHVRKGYRAELVVVEPLVIDPVAIEWDTRGRLWVVEMADYPMGMDGKGKPGGRVRVLEDTNGDGKYDKSTLFADGLNFPNGILTWRDGVLITAAPNVLFLRDTDGDGKADTQEVLLSGFLEGNQQLRVNSLRWGLDNMVYCAAGGHHRGHGAETKIYSSRTGKITALGSRDFRFDPDTGELDPESGPTQFGRNRDDWGHWFGTQNSYPLWHYVLPDHYLRRNPHVPSRDPVQQLLNPRSPEVFPASPAEKRYHSFNEAGHFTSACAGMIYQDDLLFGRSEKIHAFVCEPFHNLVHHAVLTEDGVTFQASRADEEQQSEFFAAEDRWCRPVMIRTGPDGALWVVDMYRYMIEHPDWLPPEGKNELLPNYRAGDDKGRIYRILPERISAKPIPQLENMKGSALVQALTNSNAWVRDKAQQLLIWRKQTDVVPDLEKLSREGIDARTRVQALCTLDGLELLSSKTVMLALRDSAPGVRENALRLAEKQRNSEVISAVTRLTNDANAKVQLQLAFTLGTWNSPQAGEALAQLAFNKGATNPSFQHSGIRSLEFT